MPRAEPFGPVDARPDSRSEGSAPSSSRPAHAVGPGRAVVAAPGLIGGALRDAVSGYSIQPGKVQPPPLRDETLARHRLLDWLEVKIHNRVVFVIADAGYGKTTLLADFSRRTRLRTLWYRMDREDRNWVALLSCLVAAGRVHDPDFAPRTAALLQDTGPGGATRDDALEAFLKELPSIAMDGATVILDDFHVADDVADVTHIARELVARAPERLTLVVSSRRTPTLPVARLRALGEVAELRTTDMRFSPEETDALFKETYGRALEPDVLADLSRRTDGWAASLHLVRTALRDRSAAETRTFVRSLTGAQSELYDYLAEEVVGDLPQEHQAFLMRTSILQLVEPEAAEVATGLPPERVSALIAESERLGLLSRRQGSRSGHGYHPLVREFLEARLHRDVAAVAIAVLHSEVAHWAESRDWRAASFHYGAAGLLQDLHRVLERSIESIVGSGEIALAASYLREYPADSPVAAFEVIWSRLAATDVDVAAALDHARRAVALNPGSAICVSNLLATCFLSGELNDAPELAERLSLIATSPTLRSIAAATRHVLSASLEGSLDETVAELSSIVEESQRQGLIHYEGVGLLNRSLAHRARGSAQEALRDAIDAQSVLGRETRGSEALSAELAQAWAVAHLGDLEGARRLLSSSHQRCTAATMPEWLAEAAFIETVYGDDTVASSMLDEAADTVLNPSLSTITALTRVQLALRLGAVQDAADLLQWARPGGPTQESGYLSRFRAISAQVALATGARDSAGQVRDAMSLSRRQNAGLWMGYCEVLAAATMPTSSQRLARVARRDAAFLSMCCENVVEILHRLDTETLALITTESMRRPDRWRPTIRRAAVSSKHPSRIIAAEILDMIGTEDDVSLLRTLARAERTSGYGDLGRGLARRLARRVLIEDQGRVEIRIGTQLRAGATVRRKVLALLCFLVTRPKFAATRDEVIDALWPDLAPEVALNSLNQTIYFLRRVFEPDYKDDTSAGYVHHSSDVVWLDSELIGSRSERCRALLDSMGSEPSPSEVERLSESYGGRFALDFAYEEWAIAYREGLHVAYLQRVEAAVLRDIETGHHERGIRLARRALDIDPHADGLELSLVRLYRATGAHAAAAEQYAHYATTMREELGVDPPPLASL